MSDRYPLIRTPQKNNLDAAETDSQSVGAGGYIGAKERERGIKEMPRKLTKEEIFEKAYLSEADLERLGLRSRKHSQNLRIRGEDPLPYVKIGRSIRYPAADVWAYLEKNEVRPEAE
jgi:hypothetical protein